MGNGIEVIELKNLKDILKIEILTVGIFKNGAKKIVRDILGVENFIIFKKRVSILNIIQVAVKKITVLRGEGKDFRVRDLGNVRVKIRHLFILKPNILVKNISIYGG